MQTGETVRHRSDQKNRVSKVILGEIERERIEEEKREAHRVKMMANRAGLEIQIKMINDEFSITDPEFIEHANEGIFKKWLRYGYRSATHAYNDVLQIAKEFPGMEKKILELKPRLIEASKKAQSRVMLREELLQGIRARQIEKED